MKKKQSSQYSKRLLKISCFLCFSVINFNCFTAEAPKSEKIKRSSSKDKKNMNNHELPIRTVELSTGHQLIILDKNLRKNVKVVFDFITPLKDKNNKPYSHGLSDLCEAYFGEAYPRGLNRIDFQKSLIMEDIGININSSIDRFTVSLTCHSDKVKESLEKLKSLLFSSDISHKSFELLKKKQKMSLQQAMHDPATMAREKFLIYFLGEDAPYVQVIENSIKALDSITKEDINNFAQNVFTTQTLKILFVGDSLNQSIQNEIESFIQTLSKDETIASVDSFAYPSKETIHHVDAVSPQAVVLFAHPALSKTHPDFMKFHVLKSILGSMPFESRIWQEVREKRGLAYSVTIRPYKDNVRQFTLGSLGTNPKNIDAAIDIIQKEWDIPRKITETELSLHKDYIIGSFILSFDKSSHAINTLLDFIRQDFTIDEIKAMPSAIQEVTLSEINRVAKEHLHKDKLYFFSYGKKEQGESK